MELDPGEGISFATVVEGVGTGNHESELSAGINSVEGAGAIGDGEGEDSGTVFGHVGSGGVDVDG
jgi:hypothetical protein